MGAVLEWHGGQPSPSGLVTRRKTLYLFPALYDLEHVSIFFYNDI